VIQAARKPTRSRKLPSCLIDLYVIKNATNAAYAIMMVALRRGRVASQSVRRFDCATRYFGVSSHFSTAETDASELTPKSRLLIL
jgi:hypothetical protein